MAELPGLGDAPDAACSPNCSLPASHVGSFLPGSRSRVHAAKWPWSGIVDEAELPLKRDEAAGSAPPPNRPARDESETQG